MTIKAVIFDLDGTIAGFNIDYISVRSDVRSFLVANGLPASVVSLNESIFEMLKKMEIYLKNNGKTGRKINQIREKSLEIAEKYELEAAKITSLLPGVMETLKTLKKMRLKLGLCTISSEKSANNILERFKIKALFDDVVTRERVSNVKPNPEHLAAVLRSLKVRPSQAVVVGDGISDMKCARELNVTAVGLPTGVSTPADLMNNGVDYLITSATELPELIEKLNGKKED